MPLHKESFTRIKEAALLAFLMLFLFSFSGRSPAKPEVKHNNKHQHAQPVKNKLALVSRLQVSLAQPVFQKVPALLQSKPFTPETRTTPFLFAAFRFAPQLRAQNSCRFYYRMFSPSGEEPA